jgi:hypothetical protein
MTITGAVLINAQDFTSADPPQRSRWKWARPTRFTSNGPRP